MKKDGFLKIGKVARGGARGVDLGECPFSWTQQKEGCWISATQVWKPVMCRGSACQLWSEDGCVFNAMNRRLAHLEELMKTGWPR